MTGATDDKPTQANKLQQTASSLPQPTPTNPTPPPASSGVQTSTPQPTPPQPQQTSPQPQVTPSLNDYLAQHNIYYRDNGVPYVKGANVNTEQVQKEISILTTQYEGTQYTKGESGKLAGIVQAVKESGITLDQSSFDNTGSKSGGNTPREQYAQGLIQQKATGQFISGPTNNPQTNFSQDLGIIGLSYNPQTKVVSDPLQARIAKEDILRSKQGGYAGLSYGNNQGDYIPPNLSGILSGRGLSQDYGQKSLGYTQGEYSPSQVASLINSVKTNREYGDKQEFLVGNIGTENSTGSLKALNIQQSRNTDNPNSQVAKQTSKADTSSLSKNDLTNIGGHGILTSLLYRPTQEDINKANQARQDQANNNELGFGLSSLLQKQQIGKLDDYVLGLAKQGEKQVNIYDKITGARIGTVSTDNSGLEIINEVATNQSIYLRPTPNQDKIKQNNLINSQFRDFISSNANSGLVLDVFAGENKIGEVKGSNAYRDVIKLEQKYPNQSLTVKPHLLSSPVTQPTQEKQTSLDSLVQGAFNSLEKYKQENKNNPVARILASAGEYGLSSLTFVATSPLQAEVSNYLQQAITGKTPTVLRKGIDLPYDPSQYIISTGINTITSGGNVIQAETQARQELMKESEKQGIESLITKGVLDIVSLGPISKGALPIATNTFKVMTEGGEVQTLARSVEVGIGSKTKEVLTIIDNKVYAGGVTKNLDKTALKNIEVGSEGIEFTTQGKYGTKILTSEEGLGILQQAGKVLPRDVQAVKLSKEVANIIQFSDKKVPDTVRVQAQSVPQTPLTSVLPGAESQALTQDIIPKLNAIKGTLSETVQLQKDLIMSKASFVTPSNPSPSELIVNNQVFGVNLMKGGEEKLASGLKYNDMTTGDLDVAYDHDLLGVRKGVKVAKESVDILNKVAGEGRTFVKASDRPAQESVIDKITGKVIKEAEPKRTGTNVNVITKEGKSETVLNIITKHDEKKGYLNKTPLIPYGIKLSGKIIKLPVKEGSSAFGKFVRIEQNAMNRLESSIALHGPKSEPSHIQPPEYIKEGETIQKTEKGYTVLPHEYRVKDLSKLVSQDLEQISRNLKASGYEKQGSRLQEIKQEYIKLYPEVDFSLKASKMTIEEASTFKPSLLASVSHGLSESVTPSSSLISPIYKSALNPISTKSAITPKESRSAFSSKSSTTNPYEIKSAYGSLSSSKESSKVSLDSLLGSSLVSKGSSSKSPSLESPSKLSSLTSPSLSNSVLSPSSSLVSKGSSSKSPSLESPSKLSSLTSPSLSSSISGLKEMGVSQPSKTKELPPLILLDIRNKSTEGKRPSSKDENFLGNVSEIDITLNYNRQELTYGQSKIDKLVRKDISLTGKTHTKGLTGKNSSLLGSSKKKIRL